MNKTVPYLALGSVVLFIGAAVVLLISGQGDGQNATLLIGFIISTIPSMLAAAFSERSSKDIRNGTSTVNTTNAVTKGLQAENAKAAPALAEMRLLAQQAQDSNTRIEAALGKLAERAPLTDAVNHDKKGTAK